MLIAIGACGRALALAAQTVTGSEARADYRMQGTVAPDRAGYLSNAGFGYRFRGGSK